MQLKLTNGYLNLGAPQMGTAKSWGISMIITLFEYPSEDTALFDKWALSEARTFQVQMSTAGGLTAYSFYDANFSEIVPGDCYFTSTGYTNQKSCTMGTIPLNEPVQVSARWAGLLSENEMELATGYWGLEGTLPAPNMTTPEPNRAPAGCEAVPTPELAGLSAGTPDTTGIGIGFGSREEWQGVNKRLNGCISHIAFWCGPGSGGLVGIKSGIRSAEDGFVNPLSKPDGLKAYWPLNYPNLNPLVLAPDVDPSVGALGGVGISGCESLGDPLPGMPAIIPWIRGGRRTVYDGDRGTGLKGVQRRGHRDIIVSPVRTLKARKP